MKKPDLSRFAPPGQDTRPLKWTLIAALAIALLWSFLFFDRLQEAVYSLYENPSLSKAVRPGAVMPDYVLVLGNSLWGFGVAALVTASFAFTNYAYFTSGAKPIYLMRRLPRRFELLRRCTALPLAAAAVCGLCALALLHLYLLIYLAATPEGCLAPGQWAKLWR